MKIFYTKHFPSKGYAAINLFGLIFARKESSPLSERTIRHEATHTAQMKELFYLVFYLWYGIEWIIRLIQYRNTDKAYRNISFEREAYANECYYPYLKRRKRYAFLKYLTRSN